MEKDSEEFPNALSNVCVRVCAHSTLEGYYMDDTLQGQGVYRYEDGGALHGTYVDGELNGPAQEYDQDGQLIFKGLYKDNVRCGLCWFYHSVSWLSLHKSLK